jgi:putative transcriptional regulator
MRDDAFEWDDVKAAANERKHGVTFQQAREAFDDPLALEEPDDDPDECRWRLFGRESSRSERPPGVKKRITKGKRHRRDGIWHDDHGPIPGSPASWEPPMTDAEIIAAAESDPDNVPMSSDLLQRLRRIAAAKRIRRKLGLSQEEFAKRFQIPLGTLRDWEQHRRAPDQAAQAYLIVIEREHAAVDRALAES